MARAGVWLLGSFFVSVIGVGCSLVLDMPDRQLDPDFGDAGVVAPDGGTGDASAACISYCDQVETNCVADQGGDHAVYASTTVCLAVCSQLPAGTNGDAGNSVACRTHQAVLAVSTGELGVSCPAAGPGGGNSDPDGGAVCGTNCEGYCSLMQANCSFVFTNPAGDFDTDKCMAACALVPDIGNFNVSIDEQKGNSIQCRLYHVSAATQDPTVHCMHAAGTTTCVP